jgi:hypothetical protein
MYYFLKLIITLLFVHFAFAYIDQPCNAGSYGRGVCVKKSSCVMYNGQIGSATPYAGSSPNWPCPNDPSDVICCVKILTRLRDGITKISGRCLNVNECSGSTINTAECPGSNNVKLCTSDPIPDQPEASDDKTKVATEVYNFFKGKGWTKNAICGMLGNMQRESQLNPNINEYSGGGGYGLVQWTPGSVFKNWATAKGLNYRLTRTQCLKIQDEFENGGQYYKTNNCPLTFKQYSQSTESPEYLAACFMYNYERPGVKALDERKKYARQWFNYFK